MIGCLVVYLSLLIWQILKILTKNFLLHVPSLIFFPRAFSPHSCVVIWCRCIFHSVKLHSTLLMKLALPRQLSPWLPTGPIPSLALYPAQTSLSFHRSNSRLHNITSIPLAHNRTSSLKSLLQPNSPIFKGGGGRFL